MKRIKLVANTFSSETGSGEKFKHSGALEIPVNSKYGYNSLCNLLRSSSCAKTK